jgi:predicted PurR-regulated permease PerM
MNSKPYTFDRVVRMLIGLAVLIGLFLLVKRLSSVLLPFLIAWLLAYLLNPIVLFFQFKLKFKSRILSIFSTLLLFIGAFVALVWFLSPLIATEIRKLSELVMLYTNDFNVDTFLPVAWQNELRDYLSKLDIQTILRDENLMDGIKKLTPMLWHLVYGSLNFIIGLAVVLIVFLYLIFILLDYKKISEDLIEIIPPKHRLLISEILSDLEIGMNRYFRGQALVAMTVGILFSIGFSIIQLPLAIVLGIFIGLLNMVPYLQIVGILPALVLALLKSAETGQSYLSVLLGIAIVFVVVQLIQDLLLTPKIMGKVTGLNPAVILLSLSIWGSLIGVTGMIIALPMTTLMISYYKRFVLDQTKINQNPESISESARESEVTDAEV